MKTLLIDDVRAFSADKIARTYDEGIDSLKQGSWDLLLLDHDLGEEDERKTGYGIISWLESNPQYFPRMVQIVSSNPVGRTNIERVLQKFYTKSLGTWIKNEKKDDKHQKVSI